MALARALVFVAVVAAGIAAGGMLNVLVGLLPLRGRVDAPWFAEVHRLSAPLIDRVIPPATMVAALAAAGAAAHSLPRSASALLLAGLGASALVVAVSLAACLPLNRRLAARSATAAEEGDLLRRWHRWHAVRTPLALAAFAAYAAAALAS